MLNSEYHVTSLNYVKEQQYEEAFLNSEVIEIYIIRGIDFWELEGLLTFEEVASGK